MTFVIWKILIPILVIGVLIFIHELGHFLAAKWAGVGVVKFSIGFGPSLLRWKRGNTVYQISAIPLGGFVRMIGDMPDPITGPQETDQAVRKESEEDLITAELLKDKNLWFIEKSLFERSVIVVAGPLFNLISAFFFVLGAGYFYGESMPSPLAIVGEVKVDSPAMIAGVKPGDKIIRIGETDIHTWRELADRTSQGPDAPTALEVEREGSVVTLTVTPRKGVVQSVTGEPKEGFLIGVGPTVDVRPVDFIEATSHAATWITRATTRTYEGLFGMVMGQVSPKELAGPIFIFDAASQQAKKGFEDTLYFMALLSVSLAVLNLLPIPVLDGGHLLFFFVEAIFGPLSVKKKEIAQQMGFAFLLFLMCFAITNDLRREKPQVPGDVEWEKKAAEKKEP